MNRKMRINFMLPSYSCLYPTKKTPNRSWIRFSNLSFITLRLYTKRH